MYNILVVHSNCVQNSLTKQLIVAYLYQKHSILDSGRCRLRHWLYASIWQRPESKIVCFLIQLYYNALFINDICPQVQKYYAQPIYYTYECGEPLTHWSSPLSAACRHEATDDLPIV